jgi:hypothetical protein
MAGQFGIEVKLTICIWECSIRISVETHAVLSEALRGFSQSLYPNAGIVSRLRHDRLTES